MYFALASSNTERGNDTPEYSYKGVLMRRWKPKDTPYSEDWTNRDEIVLPRSHRTLILKTAHEIPLAGHLRINKSHDKITRYFPGLLAGPSGICVGWGIETNGRFEAVKSPNFGWATLG